MDLLRTSRLLAVMILLPLLLAGSASAVTLEASDVSESTVTLSWTEYEGAGFDKYVVYVDRGNGWALERTFYDSIITEHEVTGLEAWESYSFRVTTVVYDTTQMVYVSEDSNVVTVTLEGEDHMCLLFNVLIVATVVLIIVLTLRQLRKVAREVEGPKERVVDDSSEDTDDSEEGPEGSS